MRKIALFVTVLVITMICAMGAAANGASIYSAFGNDQVGDCGYEAMANLTIHQYPSARITTHEVIVWWERTNRVWDSGPLFAQTHGFGGHKVASTTLLTIGDRGALIYAANHGGVWATVEQGIHAVAIINATAKGVNVVDEGQVGFYPWAWWFQYQTGGTNGHPLTDTTGDSLLALHWAA